jgi:hypothetical protein
MALAFDFGKQMGFEADEFFEFGDSWIGNVADFLPSEPLADRVVGSEIREPSGMRSVRIDRGNQPFAERFLTMPDDGGELWELPQLIRLQKRLDLPLVVVGLRPAENPQDFSVTSRSPMFFEASIAES